MNASSWLALVACAVLSGCVVRPEGESQEREAAAAAGAHYGKPFAERELPPLAADAALASWLAHAEVSNGELEASWHRWIAALEGVPQASSQDTTAMVGVEHRLDGGAALDRTGLVLMSDAMNNLLLPGRLEARGAAALARARIAAVEFHRVRLRLQTAVTAAFWALALRDEEIRLQEKLRAVLVVQVASMRAGVGAGRVPQQELLAAEVAVLRVDAGLASLRETRPALVAELRAQVGVADAALDVRPLLAGLEPLRDEEQAWLERALAHNPAVMVARADHEAKLAEVTEREWMRVPEFSLRGLLMGDGVAMLAGAVTLPFLRHTAIEASVLQAEAEVRAASAQRRQAGNDTVAVVVAEAAGLRAVAAESELLARQVLPRVAQMAAVARASWSAGRGAFADWAEAVVMEVEVETMVARLQREGLVGRARLAEAVGGL